LQPSRGYIRPLDGVRAIAITGVVIFHSGASGLPGGFLGVDVFFVVSGYLITSLLLHELALDGSINVGRFYARRVRRLFPALIVMVAVVTVIATLFTLDASKPTWRDVPAAALGLTNWWLIARQQNYFEAFGRPPLLQHTWSLAVETQFYLLWPVLLIATTRFARRRAVTAVIATLALVVTATIATIANAANFDAAGQQSHFFYGTDTRSIGLLVGALLAAILPKRASTGSARGLVLRDLGAGTALLSLVALFYFIGPKSGIFFDFSFLATSLTTATLIACTLEPGSRIGAALSSGIMRWIGTRSYSIYLWHWPIFQLLRPGYELPFGSVGADFVRVVLTLAVCELSFRFVEQPFRQFRLLKAVHHFEAGDFTTGFALCACICFAIVSGGLLHLMALRQGDEVEAATFAMLQKPALRPRVHHLRPSAPTAAKDVTLPLRAKRVATHVKTPIGRNPQSIGRARSTTLASNLTLHRAAIAPTTDPKSGRRHTEGSGSLRPLESSSSSAQPKRLPWTVARTRWTYASVAFPKRRQPRGKRIAYDVLPIEHEETTLLGDSIMLAASRAIAARFNVVNIDAVVSRQASVLAGVVARLHAAGQLTPVVILDLGNNGTVDAATLQGMLRELSACERVVIVNAHVPRPWEDEANETIAHVAAGYDNTVIANWHDAATGHNEYFGDDGVHPNDVGARAYTDAIVAALAAASSSATI
jgi:peptidoglycan/LPS O-acetylase OafA/YrhL